MVVVLVVVARALAAPKAAAGFRGNERASNMREIVAEGHRCSGAAGQFALQLRYIRPMNIRPIKSASLPSVRVDPQLRRELESLLQEGETLSEFVEDSVRQALARRSQQAEFIRRGVASLAAARQGESLIDADAVLEKLQQRLVSAKSQRSTDAA